MEYRKYGDAIYLRLDRGEEVVAGILEVCRREDIASATFSGVGGCGAAEIQTFVPEEGAFELRRIEGMLELVSMTGNVISDENGARHTHTHAVFAYRQDGEHRVAGGHVRSIEIRYTAEIELRPVPGGMIRGRQDPETGTFFWAFGE